MSLSTCPALPLQRNRTWKQIHTSFSRPRVTQKHSKFHHGRRSDLAGYLDVFFPRPAFNTGHTLLLHLRETLHQWWEPLGITCVYARLMSEKGTSRDRHLRYCRNRTRTRPRSCQACNAAKTKCSFQTPCSRCTKKNIECMYDSKSSVERRTTTSRSATSTDLVRARTRPCRSPSTSFFNGAFSHASDEGLQICDVPFELFPAVDNAQMQISMDCGSLDDLSMHLAPVNESLALEELFAWGDYTSDQDQTWRDVSVIAPDDKLYQQTPDWCKWTRHGLSLSIVTENTPAKQNSNSNHPATASQIQQARAQLSADVIIQSLRAFPTMMLRRETLPWFIHAQSQLLSKAATPALPEAMSTCMGIAQMFASKTRESEPFLWRTIRSEYRRFVDQVRFAFADHIAL